MPRGRVLDLPNTDGLKYVVRRGDTLQGIARSWGVDLNGVLDWNRLASSVISVGQELFLPGARMNPNELNRILGNLFMYPVQGRISSYFGERSDPFTGVPNYHNGIDIVNRPGTPVLAAMAGTVAEVGFNYNYGNYVILKHAGQYQTLYGHLTRYLVGRGQKLRQGEASGSWAPRDTARGRTCISRSSITASRLTRCDSSNRVGGDEESAAYRARRGVPRRALAHRTPVLRCPAPPVGGALPHSPPRHGRRRPAVCRQLRSPRP